MSLCNIYTGFELQLVSPSIMIHSCRVVGYPYPGLGCLSIWIHQDVIMLMHMQWINQAALCGCCQNFKLVPIAFRVVDVEEMIDDLAKK